MFIFILLFLFPSFLHAAIIVDSVNTEQFIQRNILQEDCSWIDTFQVTTTTTFQETKPVTITTGFSDPKTGTGYVGGQPGRAVSCPEDCDYSIVLGSPALTNNESLGGEVREWEEKKVVIIEKLTDNCIGDGCDDPKIPEHPDTPVPETSTLVYLCLGIILIKFSKSSTKSI